MRKVKYTFATLAIFASTLVIGQTHIGLKTGLNVSDAKANLFIDAVNNAPKTHTSFLIGAVTEIPISRSIAFQPEVQFTKKGFTINESTSFEALGINVPIGAKATTSISYIETPLLIKGKVALGSANIYGIAGPSLGYATAAKIQPQVKVLIDFNLPEVNINLNDDIYNRTEVAGVIGGGVEFGVPSGKIFSDVRYQHSFSNIINDPIADISVKNSGFQFAFGYSHAF